YGMGSKVSTYGDVYSYGILLLEMFTTKRPTNNMFKDELNLHNFVKAALPTNAEQVLDLIFSKQKKFVTLVLAILIPILEATTNEFGSAWFPLPGSELIVLQNRLENEQRLAKL
ncbi:Tyrosine-protein kinase, partial [Trema orientale]